MFKLKYVFFILVISLVTYIQADSFSFFNKKKLSDSQLDNIRSNVSRSEDVFESFTLEQEYYLGRAVGATLLTKYNILDNSKANLYINKIGLSLTLLTSKPQTYGGYHFLILDSDEINAFACPSGHIFITKGMLNLTNNEDEIAAILAHEISHVVLNHGVRAIKKSKISSFYTSVVSKAVKDMTKKDMEQMEAFFEETIMESTKTFINSGYSKEFEFDADRHTIDILEKSKYQSGSLIKVLNNMKATIGEDSKGFGKTHPKSYDRIVELYKYKDDFDLSNPSPSERYLNFIESL